MAVFYLILLAFNYSVMPRISKKFVHPKTNKKSLALVEETVKLLMGVTGFLVTDNIKSLKKWTLRSSLIAAGFPSMLYAIKGVLTYTAYQNLDSLTFNGLSQVKTLSAALCCYLVLGKPQSRMQILALGVLSATPFVFQGTYKQWMVNRKHQQHSSKDKTINNVKAEGHVDMKTFIYGVVPCLGATLISGLAGAFSQRSLQRVVGSMERNAYFYSVEISFFTAACLLVSMFTERFKSVDDSYTLETEKLSLFEYWSWHTFIPITTKACGGILTALVHKHSGSVMKGFSLVLGLVFSALLQAVVDGEDLTIGQFVGTAMVLLSSWIHFTSPPVS
jgi:UDP-sugar transporter A1/2/3